MTVTPAELNGNGAHRAEPWQPIPTSTLPAFPLDALPPAMRQWVEAIAEETQTPADLAATIGLGVLSAASLGGPTVDCGLWEEELPLYLFIAMHSGERKSPVLKAATAPLRAIERRWREEAKSSLRERITRREILKARSEKLTKLAINASDHEDQRNKEDELQEIAAELEAIGDPVAPRLLADDATPEALAGLVATHGRMALLAAEAAVVFNLVGQYNDGKANLNLACNAYSGEPTKVDRRSREEDLPRPLLSITLAVQPHVMEKLIEHPIAQAQGLVARFAFALPATRLGQRDTRPSRVPLEIEEGWCSTVERTATANPLTQPTQPSSVSSVSTSLVEISSLSLSLEASKAFHAMRAERETRRGEGGDLRPIIEWEAKHEGRILRIAGLLHLAEHGGENTISEQTMRNALLIGDYFLAHSMAALTVPDQLERRAQRWLEEQSQTTVTQRELQRGPLNSRGSSEEAAQLASALVARDWLRRRPEGTSGPGRPPSPSFDVNPHLRGAVADRPRDWWAALGGDESSDPDEAQPTVQDMRALLELDGPPNGHAGLQ